MTDLLRQAREHGTRAAGYIRLIDRAKRIEAHQGSVCVADRDLAILAAQAWANAKIAAHYAWSILHRVRSIHDVRVLNFFRSTAVYIGGGRKWLDCSCSDGCCRWCGVSVGWS